GGGSPSRSSDCRVRRTCLRPQECSRQLVPCTRRSGQGRERRPDSSRMPPCRLRVDGSAGSDRCSSPPGLQFGGWSSTEEPRHEFALIGTSRQSGEQPRKCFVHQAVSPLRGPNREPEVDEVHLDLPPSSEREPRDWVLVTGAGPHGSDPHLIRERLKQVVE